MIKQSLAAVLALLISAGLGAEPEQHTAHRHQDAHIHGSAGLTLVLAGNVLEAVLESPAANIVGFEHRPSTPDQRNAVDHAQSILESPQALFSFVGTDCEPEQAKVDVPLVMHTATHEHPDDDAELDTQSEAHDTHSEIRARYRFHCQQGPQLAAVSVALLEHFPGIEALNAMWVTDTQQGAVTLTAQARHIRLRYTP